MNDPGLAALLSGPTCLALGTGNATMTHRGLPVSWGMVTLAFVLAAALWALARAPAKGIESQGVSLGRLPLIGPGIRRLTATPWVLISLRMFLVALFLLVITAGLFGTPITERNLATMLTWNLWWAGLVFSVLLLGTAWCAVCPWDALAHWLVRRRLWRRAEPNNSLNLRVPRPLRSVWPALWLFIGLTWLELGVGITTSPYATALVALLMVVLATVSLALFERKAFCRYFCPVGRTVGFYSQLSPVELRPIEAEICAHCRTLDCYYGNAQIEPCPTWLVMGRLTQNSYCISCGNCTQSCPHNNIAWRFRSPAAEAVVGARPRWDEAWFMLILLALTIFHGLTMMPFWEPAMRALARVIGDSGRLLWSFSAGLAACIACTSLLYWGAARLAHRWTGSTMPFRRFFATFAFTALPLAFAYHLAHNLNHLARESSGLGAVLRDPLGVHAQPLSLAEKHLRHLDTWIPLDVLWALQTGLMALGFVIALQIIRHRGRSALGEAGQPAWRLAPLILFACAVTAFNLWLLMQPMVMRF